ncbi:DEAD/DEAH box helicase, putative [Plasmodium relictum]|uniref:RNA helicase n=1 Tax=Plasmodium relictum TaxID=85471 RepID=A0A1J1H2M1_PLARL|nr:DEAD/DEAH box helicase, putative [Plasmodium relictum]CRG99177.1 DEAD/DEAH box helicase, putative [Plasmodium relictum]
MDKSYDKNYAKEVMNHSFHNSKNTLSNFKKNEGHKLVKEKSYEENINQSNKKEHYSPNFNERKNTKTKQVSNLNYIDNSVNKNIAFNENNFMLKPNNADENISFLEPGLNINSNEIYENIDNKKYINKQFINKNFLNTNELEDKMNIKSNDLFIKKKSMIKENYDIKINQYVDDNQNNNNINESYNFKLNNYNITKNDKDENNTSKNSNMNMQNYDIYSYKKNEHDLEKKNIPNSYEKNFKTFDKNINSENSSLNDVINKYLMNIDNKENKFENNTSYIFYTSNDNNLMNNNSNNMSVNNINNNINETIDRSSNILNNITNSVNNISTNLNDANNMNNFLINNNNFNEWNDMNNNFCNFTEESNLIFNNDINLNTEKEKNIYSSSNIDNTNNYINYMNMLNSSDQNYKDNYSFLNNNFNKEIKFSENEDFILYNTMYNETHNKLDNFYMNNSFFGVKNKNNIIQDKNHNFNQMRENVNDQIKILHTDSKKYFCEKNNNIYMNNSESKIQDESYFPKKEENILDNKEKDNKYDDRKNNKYDDKRYNKYDDKKYNKYDDKKYNKYDDRKNNKYDDKKYNKYDDKKYNKYDDKKYNKYDDKRYNKYDDKKHNKYDDKKYNKYDDRKNNKYDDKKDYRHNDKRDHKYDEKEIKKYNKKYECNIFDDECYFIKCKIYGKEKIIVPDPLNNMEDLNTVCDDILFKNICLKGYNKMTTVQKYSIPIIKKKINLIASSQTGSGKTFSFLCPIISNLKKDEQILRPHFPGSYACISPLCLVLCPTRELAIQIFNEVNSLTKNLYLVSMVFYGGETMKEQIAQINEKQADIIISTPGRLLDLLNNCKISLSFVKYLVFDEADEMISLGFKNQMDEIIFQKDLCPNDARQTICFTATLSDKLKDVIQNFIATPYIYLNIKQKKEVKNSIKQIVKYVPMKSKLNELLRDIRNLQGQAIIFVELRNSINHVFSFLKSKGFDVNYLHGRMNQVKRQMVFEKFREKSFQILIATSIAARGLDFPDLELVINYDLPSEFDQYMHRIGRTGRIGKNGIAINYFNSSNKKIIDKLIAHLKKYDQTVPNWLLNFNK